MEPFPEGRALEDVIGLYAVEGKPPLRDRKEVEE